MPLVHHSVTPLGPAEIDFKKEKVRSGYLDKKTFPNLKDIHTDDEGAVSFSYGVDTKYLCRYIHGLLPEIKRPLVITDAGAGAGCDSMQFIAAVRDDKKTKMFSHVTSIEMHKERAECLEKNLKHVHVHHGKGTKYECHHNNYENLIDKLDQDIVHIDPPWDGASSNDKNGEELCLKNCEGILDNELSVLNILKRLKAKNERMIDSEETPMTRLLVVKTPYNWHPKTLREICDNAEGYHRRQVFKYDYWVFYLCQEDYNHMNHVKDEFKYVTGFQSWRRQQQQLLEFFPFFKNDRDYKITDEHPMFLQNIWEDPPTNEGRGDKWGEQSRPKSKIEWNPDDDEKKEVADKIVKRLEGTFTSEQNHEKKENLAFNKQHTNESDHHYRWRTCCVHPYDSHALHSHFNLHNGEKKLLESSLFTMLYGLKRIKSAYDMKADKMGKKKDSWDTVLKNTLVLYVGAAGQSAGSHHFNELIQAIPHVHFACYDIRALEPNISKDVMKDRVTVFHKIFTNLDLDRWIVFAKKHSNKSIIFISDIRSDWSHSLKDMEAGKEVARMKIKQMMCFQKESKPNEKQKAREQVSSILQQNESISESVDRHIEIDNFVQWSWFQRMARETKNVAIYSAKTRELYMRTNKKKEKYYHFPGAELFQSATRASTETRTQITADEFSLSDPENDPNGKIRDCPLGTCISEFFNSYYGDPTSFLTEDIDYCKEYQNDLDPAELWSMLPSRSVAIHDMKFAWYNQQSQYNIDTHTQDGPKGASGAGIRKMYSDWCNEYINHGGKSDNTFDVDDWCKKKDNEIHTAWERKSKKRNWDDKPRHTANDKIRQGFKFRKIDEINMDEIGRGTEEELNRQIDRYMDRGSGQLDLLTKSTIKLTHGWFSTWAAMRRYHQELVRSDKKNLWAVTVQALQTLLVLNLSQETQMVKNYKSEWLEQHTSKSTTKRAQKSARKASLECNRIRRLMDFANVSKQHDKHKNLLKEFTQLKENYTELRKKADEMNKKPSITTSTNINMPPNHVQSQLQFNLINPYALQMYTELKDKLDGRYDSIREELKIIARHGSPSMQLMFNPGSARGPDDIWLKNKIKNYGDSKKERLRVARDWYCYWLKPLLDDHDDSGLKHKVSVEEIEYVVGPYMTKSRTGVRCLGQYIEKNDVNDNPYTRPLLLHEWPLSKPVLYFACEQGSKPMIDFCLNGLQKAQKTDLVNTPRYRVNKNSKGTLQPENYPLHVAAYWGHVEVVKHLIDLGAKETLENIWQECAHSAAKEGLAEATFKYNLSDKKDKNKFEKWKKGCILCMECTEAPTLHQIIRAEPASVHAAKKRTEEQRELLEEQPLVEEYTS